MASGCTREGVDWMLGKISVRKVWSGVGPGCPGKQWSHHRGSKNMWMWHFRTWFRWCWGDGWTWWS